MPDNPLMGMGIPQPNSMMGFLPGEGRTPEGTGQGLDAFTRELVNALVQMASLPKRVYQGQLNPLSDEAIRWGADMAANMALGATAAPRGALGSGAVRPSIRAYHGSPHDFAAERLVRFPDGRTEYIVGKPDVLPDVPEGAQVLKDFPLGRQRLDKIGTGEGAQAYGPGLYEAEKEGTAKAYQEALARRQNFIEGISGEGGGFRIYSPAEGKYVSETFKTRDEAEAALDAIPGGRGHMYEVNIKADPEEFLDWDKTLKEQPRIAERLGVPLTREMRGEDFYDELARQVSGGMRTMPGIRKASEILERKGVPGIKYLDQGSRGAGEGTRNFVLFDENLVEIVRKYGIAGAATLLGLSQGQVAEAMEAQNASP